MNREITLSYTEDWSQTTPTSWVEDSSSGFENNLEPYKNSSNGLWFDFDDSSTTRTSGTLDMQNPNIFNANVNNTKWTMRFKINFTGATNIASMWIGFSDNASASDVAQRFAGCRIKTTSGFSNGSDNGGSALTSTNRTDGGTTSFSTSTDYYVTVERQTANQLVTTIRTGSHTGTVSGTHTATTLESATDDLRYWKIMNNESGAGGNIRGYLFDLEIYDNTLL